MVCDYSVTCKYNAGYLTINKSDDDLFRITTIMKDEKKNIFLLLKEAKSLKFLERWKSELLI